MAYNQVDEEFWDDTIEWPEDERDLALYLLTCRYRVTVGLFRIRRDQIAADKRWEAPRVDAALDALTRRGWLLYGDGWMLLRKSLRWTPPGGQKQIAGAVVKVKSAPRDHEIWAAFYTAAERWAPDFAAKLDRPETPYPSTADTVSGAGDTGSFSTPTQLYSTPTELAAADAGARERAGAHEAEPAAADLWAPVNEQLRQVPQWADALDRGASVACLALVQANRDVPWVQIAGTAAASRLDPDAGFTTDSPRQALGMQLEDHRSGRSTGAGERGVPRSKPRPGKSWSGAGDLSRFDRPGAAA